jgi:DNA adenine methylase
MVIVAGYDSQVTWSEIDVSLQIKGGNPLKPPSPIVKWAGGKSQLLSQFEPFFPETFQRYLEPFVGGGAVFFYLYGQGRLRGKEIVLIDKLEELINLYRVVRDQVQDLTAELQRHVPHKHDADYYYEVRAWDRRSDYRQRAGVERAARLIYLNRTCYNGLYRVNQKGQFNVPFGRYRNPTICDVDNLRSVSRSLQGVVLEEGDFSRCLEWAGPRDFVYFDPPYHPVSTTANFTNYTSVAFSMKDQERLASTFGELNRRGCQVMLSNSCTKPIQELYQGYKQLQVQALRAISSKPDQRGSIPELLVTNR